MDFTTISKTDDNVVTFTGRAFNGLSRLTVSFNSIILDSNINPEYFTLPLIPDPLPEVEPSAINVTLRIQDSSVSPSIYPQCTFIAFAGETQIWTEIRNLIVPGFLAAGLNSYCTLAEADTYHVSRFGNDSWFLLGQGEKERALIGACNILETVTWLGDKSIYTQILEWPRLIAFPRTFYRSQQYHQDHDVPFNSIEVPETPNDIKFGQAELAFQLVKGYLANSGVSRLKIGPLWIDSKDDGLLPREVKNLVDAYISRQARLIRT